MAQQSLAVTPSSRQDIVSALLSDYGNSFGDEKSPSVYSPAPPTSELPPLPPRKDSLARKPVPAAQRMDAKFQLRDDQYAPVSPSSSGEDSPSQPRKRIVSRSLSRGSKPASLKLTISNGSTATVPSPPGFQVPSQSVPSFDPAVESRPPPPPPKSEDRNREEMGSKLSKQARELARSDSLLSPGKSKQSSVVKRKEVPQAGSKNFKSLAELGNGPRGRKGAPAPTSAPRKQDVKPSEAQPEEAPRNMQAQFPPTPDEEKDDAETLAQPKKAFGLPSNPRVNALASPLHTQSRSSTGLSSLKAMRPAPPAPTVDVHTTTPEPTPSPTLKPVLAKRDFEISPVSPLPPPNNLRTSVGYEQQQQQQSLNVEPQPNPVVAVAQQEDASSSPANPALPYAPTPPIHAKTPLRITSLEFPASKDTRPMSAPSRPVSMTLNGTELSSIPGPSVPTYPVAEAPVPAPAAPEPAAMNANHDTTTKQIAPTTPIEQQPQPQPQPPVDQQLSKPLPQQPSQDQQPTPPPSPPFIPLTQQSVPMPLAVVPQITKKHTQCYTNHAQNIWSNNVFQPLACMVCHENSKERKWSCTWCQLRICRACSEELRRLPGKDVGLLVEARRAMEEKVVNGAGVMGEEVMEGSAMGVLGA